MNEYKFIHLLYVPTMACNMGCKYCYLEDNTIDDKSKFGVLDTLKYTIEKLKEDKVIPFNISLHGGEVTTLSKKNFHDLIEYIYNYYENNRALLESNGFKVGFVHIKTNLYNLEKHIDTIKEFNVSISGSLDLPLLLHDKYRVTKGGKSTLDKILKNISLLEKLDNRKKVSATIFKEHFKYLDEIVEDIKFLDKNTCLDMNDFNFMIGFDYNSNGILHHLTEDEQVELFTRMHKEFDGTNLDEGVNGAWFNEFGPDYCTNCDNCGEKFFLLERSGDIYSCVRGQKQDDYFYGNIYNDDVTKIMETAKEKIFKNHNKLEFNKECGECPYLYICKTGCPFVKNVYNSNKSYTCKLQKELYKKRNYEEIHDLFPAYDYLSKMHPDIANQYKENQFEISGPTLKEIINSDQNLKYIYDDDSFILDVDNTEYKLKSQILRSNREIIFITKNSKINIYVKKEVLNSVCDYPQNNALQIILLSGDMIQYGDEGRTKQKHIATSQIYKGVLESNISNKDEYYCYDITNFINEYRKYLSKELPNNIFFTTNSLRDYHYLKQKNNAFYHIQAINLPFQNIEFYIVDKEEFK